MGDELIDMVMSYSDIFNQNADFQRAVNLSLDQGSLELVEKYIPTVSSAAVMVRYLRAIIKPENDRASVLIGPYGKGKSHTLFVVLAVVSEVGEQAEAVFTRLADRIENVNSEASMLIRQIRNEKIRLLPIIVNDRYLDVRQAFLASVKTALSAAGLKKMMPDNYYERCLETINRWKQEFPATYQAYIQYLKRNGQNVTDFETDLKQFNEKALSLFRECHRAILSGTEFDPLIESDIPTLYQTISSALLKQTEYSGVFVVFDEFGKYLESAVSTGDRFKALQDLAELCSRSKEPRMLISCISHKAIGEYASHLNQVQRSSFRTVEGRFESIYFTSTFEGSFSLISGALGRNKKLFLDFINKHAEEHSNTIQECEQLGCFAGYESSVEQIVDQCFPMHPLTTLSLMRLSEHAGQNERTLFTFLSDTDSPLASFIRNNHGEYRLASVDMVYDYFHVSIRENSYDSELRGIIIHADSLIPTLNETESQLIKAIVLFSMVADNCLLATKKTLMAALQWDEKKFTETVKKLEQEHQIYIRRSDGVICLMRSTSENVRRDIEKEILRRSNIDIAAQLAELHDPGYTIPRRYNDKFEMVRFFQNVFVSAERFVKESNASFLEEYGFADGYIIYLLGNLNAHEVQDVLKKWNDPRVVVLLSTLDFTMRKEIEECAAIKRLLDHPEDEVAAEELSYYFEDLLQMVNQSYASYYQKNAYLITRENVMRFNNLSAEISSICEKTLYPDSPVICHEMMNRSAISGQMKQSRAKVIDAVFHNEQFLEAFPMKTAEGPIMRAVLGNLTDPKMKAITAIITDFVRTCENGKQPIKKLYDSLTKPPYGIRKGVVPILFAYCLKDKYQSAVLYNHGQELSISGESLNALDEHNEDYELLVDRGSTDQTTYIQILSDKYTPGNPVIDIRSIYDAMRKVVRSLPRSARANQKIITNGHVESIKKSVIDIRSEFIRFDGNARHVLINQLPKHCGFQLPDGNCANIVIDALKELSNYTSRLMNGIRQVLRSRMGPGGQSVHGIMTVWMQKQPASHLNHSFSGPTASLLSIIRSTENHTDFEWINMVAVALTGLPVEDWSDKQVEEFESLLDTSLSEVETAPDEERWNDSASRILLTVDGRTIEQPLPDRDIEGLASVAYDSVRSALNEFGESISTDDKLLILAKLMLHLNE